MEKGLITFLLLICLVTFQAEAWWTHSCCACADDLVRGDDFMIFTGGIDDEDLGKSDAVNYPASRRGRTL
ncbi:unnamed protein product [Rodentolepis nana]|uniref:Secreted protein n=1 Tax=Rodentolepis nana TaxID=102285 RepID=A0A0R3TP70_RODNA|nr:unnamed protein product [Rodentolepis nana]